MAHLKQFQHLKIQLQVINSATNNFADENCIGKGGFGKVYQGKIVDSSKGEMTVAWKRLIRAFGQGDPEFWKEIMMLSFYKHENIISLLGYCDDQNEKILAYEYASKRSLDLHLDNDDLTWVRRLNICIGAARGLEYLHAPSETQLRVLHRDIKSSNILLDENWNAKISDFGLSKFGPANQLFTYLVSDAVGTFGYCDPLYAELGFLTKESDVYSFGVVLFEVLCGRLCFGNNKRKPLIGLVRQAYENNVVNELVHDSIKEEIQPGSLKVFTEIAYQCLHRNREERPLMTQIVKALEVALKCQSGRKFGILKVKVIRALNLKRMNFLTSTMPYVILKLTQSSLQCAKKTSVKDTTTPEWNEEFTLYVEDLDFQCLHISVMNATSVKKHDMIGENFLSLTNLSSEHQDYRDLHIFGMSYISMGMNYINMGTNYSIMGNLIIEMAYQPYAVDLIPTQIELNSAIQNELVRGGGMLIVIIHEARSLQGKYYINPRVWVLFGRELRKTVTMMNNKDPIWEEVFTFILKQPPMDETLHLKVTNTPWIEPIQRTESIADIDLSLAEVVNHKRIIHTYKLQRGMSQLDVELQWRTND
ncbi:uncharacterized protein [Rutidosis leptorrhynchoides]|uniref:uncharacterized protein n=1 Tax=Rutidosis leptorrhynchoides TaxID=125765 RepID=UPI003A9A4F1A